jgi:protein tyrosine phosphatase (PTP) superfamily phosphohydrolase (DUF442 family)
MKPLNSIHNFIQQTEMIATAGQPTATQMALIKDAGYRHVINLGMPDHPKAVINEGALVAELGMNYIHIPVRFEAPEKSQVRYFCQLLHLFRKDPVFVHCISNFRVPVFMYHYLAKVEGLSEQDSRSLMFDHWQPDPLWQRVMQWTKEEIGL